MLRKLQIDATRADLATVRSMLAERSPDEDPIGYAQFSERAEMLSKKVAELESATTHVAEVGLYFGGRPVFGSKGILADFSAAAMNEFQSLVSSMFASLEGNIGRRGPLPQRSKTQLMLTDVARGSFGLILRQVEDQTELDSQLKLAIERAIDVVAKVSSTDQDAFETLTENLDDRVHSSLQSFVKVLENAGATLRLVDDQREYVLDRTSVSLASSRIEGTSLTINRLTKSGRLYVLPASKRFELHPTDGSEDIRGTISKECLESLVDSTGEVKPNILGQMASVVLTTKQLASLSGRSKPTYQLEEVGGLQLHYPLLK